MLILIEHHINDTYKILNSTRLIVPKRISSHISKNKLTIMLYKKHTEGTSEKLNPENNKLPILLYCPNKDELNYEIDWSERKMTKMYSLEIINLKAFTNIFFERK